MQVPHAPPQVSGPHCLPVHCGLQVLPHPPQLPWHRLMHAASHAVMQQNGSASHTHFSQPHPAHPGAGLLTHPSLGGHTPQSFGHNTQFSVDSHLALPHKAGHCPQSCTQLLQVSPATLSQKKSPHLGAHLPQSVGQVWQVSPAVNGVGWVQMPSPQLGPHGPQSLGQVLHDSPAAASHLKSPQLGLHGPQSVGQLEHVSTTPPNGLVEHWPSPQNGLHGPQSVGQVWQFS